jgi:hypothetical protein
MERIVIVDGNDNFIGEEDKDKCHDITHKRTELIMSDFRDREEALRA